jgi:hypothetical protein
MATRVSGGVTLIKISSLMRDPDADFQWRQGG